MNTDHRYACVFVDCVAFNAIGEDYSLSDAPASFLQSSLLARPADFLRPRPAISESAQLNGSTPKGPMVSDRCSPRPSEPIVHFRPTFLSLGSRKGSREAFFLSVPQDT